MRTASLLCCIVLAATSVAFAQKRAEVTATFRQEVDYYAGCRLIDPYNTEVKREGGTIHGMCLVFTDIKLPGQDENQREPQYENNNDQRRKPVRQPQGLDSGIH